MATPQQEAYQFPDENCSFLEKPLQVVHAQPFTPQLPDPEPGEDAQPPSDDAANRGNKDNSPDKPAVTAVILKHLFGDNIALENVPESVAPDSPSRKRSARAASLPDSVTDSERLGGSFSQSRPHHKSIASTPNIPQARVTPSRIPRPVSVNLASDALPGVSTPSPSTETTQPKRRSLILANRQATWIRDVVRDNVQDKGESSSPVTSRRLSWEDKNPRSQSTISADRISVASPDTPTYRERPVFIPEADQPQFYVQDKVFYLRCGAGVPSGKYRISISCYLGLTGGTTGRGWREFIIPGLPRFRNDVCGYIYFWTPPNQGMEFRTSQLKRYTLSESCLMGQVEITPNIVIPLRTCDGKFYGWLKDFQVKQTIRSDLSTNVPGFGGDVIKYYAVCSINLVQSDFWSENCGLTLYVYGGPEGQFTGHLGDPVGQFQMINLKAPGARIGRSELQLLCSPSNLNMLVIGWEVRIPQGEFSAWVPHISGTTDNEIQMEDMQTDFVGAEQRESLQVVHVTPLTSQFGPRGLSPRKRPSWPPQQRSWKVRYLCGLFCFLSTAYCLYYLYPEFSCSCELGNMRQATQEMLVPKSDEPGEPALPVATMLEFVESQSFNEPEESSIDSPDPTQLSVRDRVDYFLGWSGPIHRE